MYHLADFHTYTEAEEFGLEGVFLMLNYDRNKRCFGMKCMATGAPILYQQMHTHVCSHTYVNENDLTKPKCNNIFDRVKIAAERATHCKMAICEDLEGQEDSGEALAYMKAIEDFEQILNTARISCIFMKRRYNMNYKKSVTHLWEQTPEKSDDEEIN